MKAETRQGLFITLINLVRTLTAQPNQAAGIAQNTDDADTVPITPRPEAVANLLVLRALSRAVQQRLETRENANERVFRYSSSSSSASSGALPPLKQVLG